MNIAIYGAGQCGQYVLEEIQSCKSTEILSVVFIDNNYARYTMRNTSIPIVGLKTFFEKYKKEVDVVLIAVSDLLVAQEMILSLLYQDYSDVLLIPDTVYNGRLPILDTEGEFMPYIKNYKEYKPVLSYIEYHVSDFCNLKCKGCGHFSNTVTEKRFPDIREFKKTLCILSEKFKDIVKFRLMGGEPFVNPDLDEFLFAVKHVFPYSDLRIVTNGLLFPGISEKVIKAIRECNAIIDISQYPPTRRMIGTILEFAEENQIKVKMGKEIIQFKKQIVPGINNDYEAARKYCMSSSCHFLRGNRLYPCAAVLLYENKKLLELDISEQFVNRNSIDLINGSEDGWNILKKVKTPSEFCKYCDSKIELFEWSVSGKEIRKEEWIVDMVN